MLQKTPLLVCLQGRTLHLFTNSLTSSQHLECSSEFIGKNNQADMRDDLILLNEQLHEEADDILDKKGLRKILDRYGILHVTGSYSLGLMTWRDLDIYLEAEGLTEQTFFELGKDIDSLL